MIMNEIDVNELKEKQESNKAPFLLDVREEFEYHISNIGGKLIPLNQLPDRLSEIEDKKDAEIVVMCRSGSRSADACELLKKEGFTNVVNLKGGINDWARKIDTSLPVY